MTIRLHGGSEVSIFAVEIRNESHGKNEDSNKVCRARNESDDRRVGLRLRMGIRIRIKMIQDDTRGENRNGTKAEV